MLNQVIKFWFWLYNCQACGSTAASANKVHLLHYYETVQTKFRSPIHFCAK